MTDDTTAPVTAEGPWKHLHGRFKKAILDQAATWEEDFDAGPGDVVSVSDAASVIACLLAGDPGDLPARMSEAMRSVFDDPPLDSAEEFLQGLAAAALSVRWEHAAHLAAALEHARAELSSRIEQHQRAVTRAIAAEAERDALRADDEIAQEQIGNLNLRIVKAERRAGNAEAERDALMAAIETGSVAGFAADIHRLVADYSSKERGVIALAPFEATLDQLCLEKYGFDLDRAIAALDAPETTGDARAVAPAPFNPHWPPLRTPDAPTGGED